MPMEVPYRSLCRSISLLLSLCTPLCAHCAERPVDLANPLVGTASLDDPHLLGNAPPAGEEAYTGLIFPGPAFPHQDVHLTPINKDLTEAAHNHGLIHAYTHSRHTMLGFSSHMPGLTIMPIVGEWTAPPDRVYASAYDKATEKASPGYYSVYFPDHQIKCELTTTEHTGFYRFTFPKTDRGVILLDLGADTSSIEIVGDHTIRGQRGGDCFVAEFSKPFASFGTFRQNPPRVDGGRVLRDDVVRPDSRSERGSYAGTYLNFSTTEGETVLVKIASAHTFDAAQQQLQTENPAWDFDAVHKQLEDIWAQKLNLVEVKGGTEKERKLFYSTLYHSLMTPRLIARKGTPYRVGDREITLDYDRYTPIAFWDTGRNQTTLLTILEPDLKQNILRTTLEMARESGYMHTSFHGDHASLMFLGDWERGIPFDYAAAYEYLRKNATDPRGPRGRLAEYMEKGWIHDNFIEHPSPPNADGDSGVAKTLEYSWDDYAMACYAKKLGKEDDYRMFLARAHNYANVFDTSTGFVRGRTADGAWISPFYPEEPYYNYMMKEASAWQTLWLVPHDIQGLITLLGGRESFNAKLDTFFSKPYQPKGIARDVTGVIGQYCQGNQPDQHAPYLYDCAGQPWKTQEVVRKVLRLMYGSDKDGLAFPGMDDQGCMASWYVFSAMGFYPVDPSRPDYLIGSPIFDQVTIHLSSGKTFTITAHNNSPSNLYIQSATLNGQPLDKPWFTHADLASGGALNFEMGPTPCKTWGSSPSSAPPSMSR